MKKDNLQGYLEQIAVYDREFAKWEKRSAKIIERYRDEKRKNTETVRFNVLWSNVQTLVPATFARIPQADVSRRFRDNDPVGRVASLILERALEFEIQHYADYRSTMRQSVLDRFLGGRGTAWIRYEPHFTEVSSQITEDVDNQPMEEQLDYECAPVDYVHWKDFGHSVARTWEEVTLVWRWVFMGEDAVKERFGEKIAKKIPYDASPDDKKVERQETPKQAKICELWDKDAGIAVWFSKALKEVLDTRRDPLKLQEFFPCPRPLFSTLTNDTLVPVPDFTLYQDQANELDILSDRIDGLTKMLQVKGVYDGSADASIARLFTEGSNGTLLPVKNWAAFAEKSGLKGQIDVYDFTPIAKALEVANIQMEQIKNQIYEIMGIADIIRGASDPNETLGAQEMKGQYASMRLNQMKGDVSRYATDILQLKAQILCSKFNPKTLAAISAVDQLNDADKQYIGPALALLIGEERMQNPEADSPNPLRSFRVEVNADSMVQMNEQEEKQSRMEFLTANGTFMEKATQMVAQAGAAAPIITPLIMEMWKFGVTGFKVGKSIEGAFDDAADKLKQLSMQPPPPQPNPEMMKVQQENQRMQADHQQSTQQMQMEREQAVAEEQRLRQVEVANHQRAMEEIQSERAAQAEEQRMETMRIDYESRIADRAAERKETFDRWKVKEDNNTKIIIAEIGANAQVEGAMAKGEEKGEEKGEGGKPKRLSAIDKLGAMHSEQMKLFSEHIERQSQHQSKPTQIEITRPDGSKLRAVASKGS